MRTILTATILSIFSFLLISCDGDYRPLAEGNTREVVVVMDSTKWESATAQAIRETIGRYVFTVPNAEPYYDLQFTQIRSQSHLERLRKHKNLIFAAPIDEESNVGRQIRGFLDESVEERVKQGESFAFPVIDQWYRDQYVLILTSTSDSTLAQKIRNTENSLLSNMLQKELKRWEYFVYEKKEQTNLSDSLWEDHGFKVRFQHDYVKNVDTLNFQTYRRFLPQNDRWMWIWWKNDVEDISFLDDNWINTTRDSLSREYIKGARDSMYVNTYYGRPETRPVITESFQKGRLLAYETRGTWHMVNGAMGGPFVNFTYYDPDTNRLFMIEYSQFAPSVRTKLPFVRQFRAMGRTFQSDSTWTPEENGLPS
ncbi:DUF4837 family protein [Gracilimonas mengyeensis]|uniref:DUF4837 domain-containing protein n=1 Tax=Gracilimonas mengyeensis TaxID=1302730 RepID=A0A521AH07_9BACT|nr:DUF4837 family protein [Gracilimonas mengyeensis]SMO34079.1 protein of unknown function [Gracilimonas mengyeensis]